MTNDTDYWQLLVPQYRDEPAIAAALAACKKKAFRPDPSLVSELQNSFPFLRKEDEASRTIRGPADLTRGLAVAAELQALKDRSAEINLVYDNIRGKLERLHDVVRTNLFLKKEVITLKNDAQRLAVVSLVCPEIENRLAAVKRICSAADTVNRNVNQSYNILKLQVDMVKEMMYEGGLAKSLRGDRS